MKPQQGQHVLPTRRGTRAQTPGTHAQIARLPVAHQHAIQQTGILEEMSLVITASRLVQLAPSHPERGMTEGKESSWRILKRCMKIMSDGNMAWI